MGTVAITTCDSYDIRMVRDAIAKLLADLGGIEQFVKPDEKVLIKPNLLRATTPEEVVTTHPSIVEAVIEQVKHVTGNIMIADSPGGPFKESFLKRIYSKTGMKDVAERTNTTLNWSTETTNVSYPDGLLMKRLDLAKFAVDADCIISLPKLKTHTFVNLTCACKNLFGCIPGMVKPSYHGKLSAVDDFATMLLDINEYLKPNLTIIDAIQGMDRNGPNVGRIRQTNLLLAGRSWLDLDVVVCHVTNIDIDDVPMLRVAKKHGLHSTKIDDIEVRGLALEEIPAQKYELPAMDEFFTRPFGRLIARGARRRLTARPKVKKQHCIGCGTCVTACPKGCLAIVKKKAVLDRKECIRCYCCHELCPNDAIALV